MKLNKKCFTRAYGENPTKCKGKVKTYLFSHYPYWDTNYDETFCSKHYKEWKEQIKYPDSCTLHNHLSWYFGKELDRLKLVRYGDSSPIWEAFNSATQQFEDEMKKRKWSLALI